MMREHQWLNSDPGLKTGVHCRRIFSLEQDDLTGWENSWAPSLSHLPAKDTERGTRNRLSLEDTEWRLPVLLLYENLRDSNTESTKKEVIGKIIH